MLLSDFTYILPLLIFLQAAEVKRADIDLTPLREAKLPVIFVLGELRLYQVRVNSTKLMEKVKITEKYYQVDHLILQN